MLGTSCANQPLIFLFEVLVCDRELDTVRGQSMESDQQRAPVTREHRLHLPTFTSTSSFSFSSSYRLVPGSQTGAIKFSPHYLRPLHHSLVLGERGWKWEKSRGWGMRVGWGG